MSDAFPLESDAFSGGARLTAQQQSEGRASDQPPLYELMNRAAQSAEASGAMTGAVDLSAAPAAVVAAANREVTTNAGAARAYTLPDFASAPDGWEHTFIDIDSNIANTLTVTHAGTDTINGTAGDVTLNSEGEWCKVMKLSGATGWVMIGSGSGLVPA